MRSEKFLSRRWNNWLTVGMGIPVLIYIAVVLSTSILSDFTGFVGMVILGALY